MISMPRMGVSYIAGSSQNIDTDYKPTIPADGGASWATWFKIPPGCTGVIMGGGKVVAADWNRVQINCQAPDKLRVYVKDDAPVVVNETSVKTVLDNRWHHITAVIDCDNDLIRLIIDAVIDIEKTGVLGVISLTAHEVGIGCLINEAGHASYITGILAEPAFYSRVIGIPEVRLLMKGTPVLAGLELYYPMKVDSRFGTDRLVNAAHPGISNGTLMNTPRVIPCPGIVTPWG